MGILNSDIKKISFFLAFSAYNLIVFPMYLNFIFNLVVLNTMVPKVTNANDEDLDEFVTTLRTQLEIFVNRMKSNSSRGRSITNDSSVQTLFMNTMAMHSKLLKHIQDQEDKRVHYEGLQVNKNTFYSI